jgi:hypothetical protein
MVRSYLELDDSCGVLAMKKTALMTVVLYFGTLSIAPAIASETIRCGDRLVDEGDTRDTVRAKCGDPTDISKSVALKRVAISSRIIKSRVLYTDDQAIEIPIESWIYNFGSNRFMVRLRFVDGTVESIETLGYGHD